MAYFAITGSGPGILGELLSSTLNVNAMLWRTSPAATELEERVCDWLRQMVGLPAEFRGHINDTASVSTLLALAAARHRLADLAIREQGLAGRAELTPLTVYASDQAHSSFDKGAMTLGFGLDNVRRVASDSDYRMDPAALDAAISEDLAAVAEVCRRHGIWLHVDAAYAGSAAICPELRARFDGWEAADSIVLNPHKWLFTPIDCSLLLVRDLDTFRATFSLVPDYLKSEETGVTNLMDLGVQLGRRFRALKLWMVIRAFGVEGLQERIREHCRMGNELASWIEEDPRFELAAPVPFSVVCFRWLAGESTEEQNRLNDRLLHEINTQGPIFLSATTLEGRTTLRVAIGNLKTTDDHVYQAWQIIQAAAERLTDEA
jgi:aromatic-L-amino-acid decarboxylase